MPIPLTELKKNDYLTDKQVSLLSTCFSLGIRCYPKLFENNRMFIEINFRGKTHNTGQETTNLTLTHALISVYLEAYKKYYATGEPF